MHKTLIIAALAALTAAQASADVRATVGEVYRVSVRDAAGQEMPARPDLYVALFTSSGVVGLCRSHDLEDCEDAFTARNIDIAPVAGRQDRFLRVNLGPEGPGQSLGASVRAVLYQRQDRADGGGFTFVQARDESGRVVFAEANLTVVAGQAQPTPTAQAQPTPTLAWPTPIVPALSIELERVL